MKLNGNKKYLTFGSYSYIHTESIKKSTRKLPRNMAKKYYFSLLVKLYLEEVFHKF